MQFVGRIARANPAFSPVIYCGAKYAAVFGLRGKPGVKSISQFPSQVLQSPPSVRNPVFLGVLHLGVGLAPTG